jgi:hypothetical protein
MPPIDIAASEALDLHGPLLDAGVSKRPMHRQIGALIDRERRHIQSELVQAKGLVRLLVKPRNKQHWTTQDKSELRLYLKCLSRICAYMAVLLMPGGLVVLPVMAWWLHRRRASCTVPTSGSWRIGRWATRRHAQ